MMAKTTNFSVRMDNDTPVDRSLGIGGNAKAQAKHCQQYCYNSFHLHQVLLSVFYSYNY